MNSEVDPFRDPSLYTYERIPWLKRFKADFRMLDLYALPITLRYKNQKKFYTNYGACSSLVLIIIVFGYLGICFHEMMLYTTYTTSELW